MTLSEKLKEIKTFQILLEIYIELGIQPLINKAQKNLNELLKEKEE